MDVKRSRPLILLRDAAEGRLVARHIALEAEPSQSPTDPRASDPRGQTGVGAEVCSEEMVIQLESDMLPIGAELQMDTASSDGLGSLPDVLGEGDPEGNPDEPLESWFEPLGEDDMETTGEETLGSNRVPGRPPKRKWRRPVEEDEDWDDCTALGPGWKRKVVFRQSSLPSRKRFDTYYITPDGCRVRSKVELAKHVSGGVDLIHFDFSSGLFLDEESRLKYLNHVEEVQSSSRSTSVTGTPDVDRNPNPYGPPGTPQQTPPSLPFTGAPSAVPATDRLSPSGVPATDRLSPSGPLPSRRHFGVAGAPPGKDVIRRSSQSPLVPGRSGSSGLQMLSPTENDLSQLGLQIPERHRKVVVVLRPDLDLDPITCPPPRHLALVTQWTRQCNGSNMALNGHQEMDLEDSPEKPLGLSVKESCAERIQHLNIANTEDAVKKSSPSIVFRKVGDDTWVLGGKHMETEVDSFSKTSLYNKKKLKKLDRNQTKATRRASISRKVKMKAPVKDLDEEGKEKAEVIQDKVEEKEEEKDEREEIPMRRTRTSQQKIRMKEKEEEEEWRPNKIVHSLSDVSESDEGTEVINIPHTTGKSKRSQGCGACAPCQRIDCNKCVFCLDKPRNGGLNRKKQKCKYRRCLNMHTKKYMREMLYQKRRDEQYGQRVLIGPEQGRVVIGPSDIPEIGLDGLPGSVPGGPGGIPLGTRVSFFPESVARHASEYFILEKKQSQWHSPKSGSEHRRGQGRDRGRGRGRPPEQSQVPLSDTPATDDTEEDEEPVYPSIPRHPEEEEGEDGGVWRELRERDDCDDDGEAPEQALQMSPCCMSASLSNGVFGSEEARVRSCSQPYPQSCYQGDHGNLQVIRMNGHQITSITPGPTLASLALPFIYPAAEPLPEDYFRSEPNVHYLRSEPPNVHYLRSEPPNVHYLRSEPPSVHQRSKPPSLNSRSQLQLPLSPSQPPSGVFPPDYNEERQLVELYAEIPRTIINLGPPDPSGLEVTGPKVTPWQNSEVDVACDDVTPVITETFSLAVGPESGAEDWDAELFGFLRALRRTVLPAHWVGVMARGPLLQLLQCSKLSTMADTVLQIEPGFCYQVTVQGQPLLLTHPLYDAHPPRLTSIPQLVTLLLDLEACVVCPGFPVTPLTSGDRSMQVLELVQCVRAVACDLLVPRAKERCGRCSVTVVEEDLGPVEELEFECTEDERA